VNVQVVNGEGSTATVNGAGNLVSGYDETPQVQTAEPKYRPSFSFTVLSFARVGLS
jgi:hypothetical protein